MSHQLKDEFIFGAFNVLWLDMTIDDVPKMNAFYPIRISLSADECAHFGKKHISDRRRRKGKYLVMTSRREALFWLLLQPHKPTTNSLFNRGRRKDLMLVFLSTSANRTSGSDLKKSD